MRIFICRKAQLIFGVFALVLIGSELFSSPKYPITNFTPTDYNGGIQNIDFAQNRDMNLFMANNLGVLSFNGDNWQIHARDTGKKQRSLAFDTKTNRLYVGSQGEFGYFEGDWNYVSLSNQLPGNSPDFDEVWDVFIHDDEVYFCTFQGIFVYNESLKIISNEIGFDRSFHTGQELFTQNSKGKLYKIVDSSLGPAVAQGQENEIVAGVISSNEGHYIFYNSGAIELSTINGAQPAFATLEKKLTGQFVNHVLKLSDNRLVISTQRAGLFLYSPADKSIENVNSQDGLQSNACLRSFQDYNGNLWVGMQSGMALIDINSPLRLINREHNLQGSGYEAFEVGSGTYYTTSNGIFYLEKGQNSAKFLEGTAGPAYSMRVIEGKLYAGHHTGLFLLDQDKAKRISTSNGLWEVKQLRSNPNYAIGGTYEGLHLFKLNELNQLRDEGKIEGFYESSRFFEEDYDGRIWVSQFYKGIYKLSLTEDLKTVEVTKISDSYDIAIKEHTFLTRVDNEIYFGTEEGIYKLDQNSNDIVKTEQFNDIVGDSWVYLFTQDRENNIHVYTEDVVGYFKQIGPNNYGYVPSSVFQLRQSFNNDLINLSVNVSEGVFFNANEGFISYKPILEDPLLVEKKPLITMVRSVAEDSTLFAKHSFEEMPPNTGPISMEEGIRILQFKVESFKYRNMGNKQYRYYLKGFENEYGDWTNSTVKEYTNLKSGNYELFVQTVNSQGEIITSDPLEINVYPPFYKSNWAKLLFVASIIVLIFFGYRIQRRYYKNKASRMEKSKQQEINQKQSELQNLKKEQVESELRHVNNLLAASTMNLVVKNEFMENIKEAIKKVNVDKDITATKKELNKITKEIDTTLKVQEDWEQFEYHFDKVHGDFLTRLTSEYVDLTPGEQKLCAFLRLKMDTKEIANLMGISLRGVEVARYRLRKKLGLENYQNLSKFILEY